MFGLTEFNVSKEKDGWRINLVSGKNDTVVLKGIKLYATGKLAYKAAERLWEKLNKNARKNLLPVRYKNIP
jgi:hypothetical protein